jgi:hypothetical protein
LRTAPGVRVIRGANGRGKAAIVAKLGPSRRYGNGRRDFERLTDGPKSKTASRGFYRPRLAACVPETVFAKRSAPAQCFFGVAEAAGVTLMGGEPEGEVVGGDFLACFGFFTSRLLRI